MRIATIGLKALVTLTLAGIAFTASAAPYHRDGTQRYAANHHRVVHHRRFAHPVRHHHHRVVHHRAVVRAY